MKRSFSFDGPRATAVVLASTTLVAATYGLVRLAYGLFLPDVQADVGLGTSAAGLVSSGASLVYCLGAAVGFVAGDRHPRRLVVAAAATAGVGSAGMAASVGPTTFAVAAVLASAGAGLASPALVSIVGRSVAAPAVDRAQTTVNAGTGPGLVGAGVLALVLLPDWRLAWAGVAVATVAVAVVVLALDRRPDGDGAADGTTADVERPPVAWFGAHARLVVAALLMGAGSAAVWSYGRAHLVDAGAAERTSVTAWIAIGLGGATVVVTARALAARHPRDAWVLTTLVLAAGVATLALWPDRTGVALVACAAFGWGYTAATGVLIAWTGRLDADRAAAGTSMLFVVLVLGQAVGSAAAGLLVPVLGHGPTFLLAAAVTTTAALVPWWPAASRPTVSGRPAGTRPGRRRRRRRASPAR